MKRFRDGSDIFTYYEDMSNEPVRLSYGLEDDWVTVWNPINLKIDMYIQDTEGYWFLDE